MFFPSKDINTDQWPIQTNCRESPLSSKIAEPVLRISGRRVSGSPLIRIKEKIRLFLTKRISPEIFPYCHCIKETWNAIIKNMIILIILR